jgi:hypothetical protein
MTSFALLPRTHHHFGGFSTPGLSQEHNAAQYEKVIPSTRRFRAAEMSDKVRIELFIVAAFDEASVQLNRHRSLPRQPSNVVGSPTWYVRGH